MNHRRFKNTLFEVRQENEKGREQEIRLLPENQSGK